MNIEIGDFVSTEETKSICGIGPPASSTCANRRSTMRSGWKITSRIVPADDKDDAGLIVSQIILGTLEGLKMAYPEMSDERQQKLLEIRKELRHEGAGAQA